MNQYKIQTVQGSLDLSAFDFICPHEHLLIDMTHEAVSPASEDARVIFEGPVTIRNLGLLRRNPYLVKSNLILDSEEEAVSELQLLESLGRGLLIDVTSIGLGRDVRRLQRIAKKSKAAVAVGCGFFTHDAVPKEYLDWKAEQLGEHILTEIFLGIDDTGIIPAVIGEIAVSEEILPFERESLVGAAIAQRQSGLPIYLHTYPWSRSGLEAVRILMENGVRPDRICVCHLDVAFNTDYLYESLNMGVYVEFDNFGKEFYFLPQDGAFAGGPFETDRVRVEMLKKLLDEGYENQLLMANDVCLKSMLCAYGGWGYGHVHQNIRQMLEAEGVPPGQLDRLFLENPREFLAGK